MAQTLEYLSRQNNTLGSIRGIVHTMKTLSAINAAPYEQAARSIKAYHRTILQGFATFAVAVRVGRDVEPPEHRLVLPVHARHLQLLRRWLGRRGAVGRQQQGEDE